MCENEYIFSTTELKERGVRIKAIIAGLEQQYAESLTSSADESYMLDDGQTKIQTSYRDPNQIIKAIEGYERLLTRIENYACGRVTALRDARSWHSRWGY